MRDITILSQLEENGPGENKKKQQELRAYDNSFSLVAAFLVLGNLSFESLLGHKDLKILAPLVSIPVLEASYLQKTVSKLKH